jgi:hypothetical protein
VTLLHVTLTTGLGILMTVSSILSAQDSVALGGPEVVKLTWSSRSLESVDLDQDDRTDLVVLDNDRSRIILLYQQKPGEPRRPSKPPAPGRWTPVLEDARFATETVSLEGRAFDLEVADLNGDGRPDLAFTGSPDGLTIRYQGRRGRFDTIETFDMRAPSRWRHTMHAGDLNGDGRTDLAVCTTEAFEIFLQNDEGRLEAAGRYPITDDERFGVTALDLNGDGRTDLLSQVANSDRALRVRYGAGDGTFGAELATDLSGRRGLLQDLGRDETLEFVSINATTNAIETVRFEPATDRGFSLDALQPRLITLRESSESGDCHVAVGDVDGDGRPDLAVADSRASSITLLRQTADGRFARSDAYPSLAEVRAMAAADLNGDGRDDLVVVSPTEGAVAWTSQGDGGRLHYPEPIPIGDGKPLLIATGKFDGRGRPDVVVIVEESKQYRLERLSLLGGDADWESTVTELEKFRVPPRGLEVADANQDGRDDLIVFTAHEPARILLQEADGGFAPASQTSGFQRGLLDDKEASAFATGDVDGDGLEEMLFAGGGFVRALRLGDAGTLEVVDQFNSRSPGAELAAGVVWRPQGADGSEVALIGSRGSSLERLQRDRDGVFRSRGAAALDAVNLRRARVVDLGRGDGTDLLIIGSERITWIPTTAEDLRPKTTVIHETDPLEVRHGLIATGDLDADGAVDVVAVDATESRVLEVLQSDGNQWESTLRFTVFESDPHYEGQTGGSYEPREMLVEDVTGDGREDLILLVHDRLLVYPQIEAGRTDTSPDGFHGLSGTTGDPVG